LLDDLVDDLEQAILENCLVDDLWLIRFCLVDDDLEKELML
jgi:hypothetical protein